MAESDNKLLSFRCPKCGKRLKASPHVAGKSVKCPKCTQLLTVPGIAPATEEVTQWLELDAPSTTSAANAPTQRNRQQESPASVNSVSDLPELQSRAIDAEAAKATAKGAREEIEKTFSKRKSTDPRVGLSSKGRSAATRNSAEPTAATDTKNESQKKSLFDDDLPDLQQLTETPKAGKSVSQILAAHGISTENDLNDLGDLIPDVIESDDLHSNSASLTPLYDEDRDPEYRIICKTCGTAQYVRISLKGCKIKCPDCFSEFKAPPPPPDWSPTKKKKKVELDTADDMTLAPVASLDHGKSPEKRPARSAAILARAEQEVSEEDLERLYETDFDTAGFLQRTFGFATDPVAVAHLVAFGIVYAILFAIAQLVVNNLDDAFGRGYLLIAVIGLPLLGLLFALPMLSAALALLESVANRQLKVSDWPTFNLFENTADVLSITLALMISIMPGFIIGGWLGGDLPGAGRVQLSCVMITSFLVFPIVLLSMLDSGNMLQFISKSVAKSFSDATEAWGGYYLKTLVAFASTMLIWYLLLGLDKSPILAGIGGLLLPLLAFFTCQQLGVLADQISDLLHFEFQAANLEVAEQQSDDLASDGDQSAAQRTANRNDS